MELRGTTAAITGSTGKLGSAIALALAQRGCDCLCHYHKNAHLAKELVKQIEGLGQRAVAVGVDLTSPEGAGSLFDEMGGLDTPRILINSAAVFSRQPLGEATFKAGQKLLATNLLAPVLTSRHFVERVNADLSISSAKAKAVAKIINLVDVGAQRPWAEYSLYCASKAGLVAATKSLAKELAPKICVNAVAPGIVAWPEGFDRDQKDRQLAHVPMGRIGEIDELTSAVIFLLENDYITGQVLNIDGGRCI
ncbi:MAG: SDR family oxidoreductase [Planctomycetes bacterium]|nr:SDR family oxidoreductase [Planctomycetota bacterium]